MARLRTMKTKLRQDIGQPQQAGATKPQIDVMVGIPSWQGGIDPETQTALDKMLMHCWRVGVLAIIKKAFGSLLPRNRNNILRAAIKSGAKYCFMLDTDMLFPEDILIKLMAHDKPIVSALAFCKPPPHVPNMYIKRQDNAWSPIVQWKKGEVLEVDAVGGALLMIKVDAIKHIPEPWFAMPLVREMIAMPKIGKALESSKSDAEIVKLCREAYRANNSTVDVVGEDNYFCDLMNRYNIPIYADTTIETGHVGRFPIGYEDFHRETAKGIMEESA